MAKKTKAKTTAASAKTAKAAPKAAPKAPKAAPKAAKAAPKATAAAMPKQSVPMHVAQPLASNSMESQLREELAAMKAQLEAVQEKAGFYQAKSDAIEQKSSQLMERAARAEGQAQELRQRAELADVAERNVSRANERAAKAEAIAEVLRGQQDNMPAMVGSIVQSMMMLRDRRRMGVSGGALMPVKIEMEDALSSAGRSGGPLPITDLESAEASSQSQSSKSPENTKDALLDFYGAGSTAEAPKDAKARATTQSRAQSFAPMSRGAIGGLKGVLARAAGVGGRRCLA
eukprot:TRINITY_DN48343_c0_g1_i1.p1 TRINITY_DN48343_c0_g1~~TRINITY_DN48343_c0_g1_i1.p1  ORF type:complete len:288 (-),score=100.99 TRINITY_DN48343_c0_g1_i1:104-967(-)